MFGDQLPAPTVSTPALGTHLDVDRALAQVLANDRKEMWAPDVLNHEDVRQFPDRTIERAHAKLLAAKPVMDPVDTVEIPKGDLLTRAGALLSIEDRVVYQAIANELAPHIEKRLHPNVFSSRLNPRGRRQDFFLAGLGQWKHFQQATSEAQAEFGPWFVETDFVSYFDTIPHRQLFELLGSLGAPELVAQHLRRVLDQLRGDTHHGLPTGPEASRLFGNFYLSTVDSYMAGRFLYFRYMDDIRIVASTRDEALEALRTLEIESRRLGLVLSSAKTKVHCDPMGGDAEGLDVAEYFFRHRLQESRPILRELLNDALAEDRIKPRHAKFALIRLAALVDDDALQPVLDRLGSITELARESATYFRAFISDPTVQQALSGSSDLSVGSEA